jgi:hypothetical protein
MLQGIAWSHVILSEAKDPSSASGEILRCAQDDSIRSYFVATFFTSLIPPDPVSMSILPLPSPILPVM